MAFNEQLADRLAQTYAALPDVTGKKMFGGMAFMVNGHMSCGVVNDVLMVRVGPERYARALERPHARVMDFTKKPLTGFVYVDPPGFESDEDLQDWVNLSLDFVMELPPK